MTTPYMPGARVFNSIYWLALALWVGSTALAVGSAFETFSTINELNVTVPALAEFDAMAGRHTLFAAGRVQNNLFFFAEMVQDVSIILVAAITVLHFTVFRFSLRRPANRVRLLAVLAVLAAVCLQMLVLSPRMNQNIRRYWDLPHHKDVPSALAAKESFDADHTLAAGVLLVSLFGGMTIIVSSACSMTPAGSRKPETGNDSKALEEPALAST